MTKGNAMDELSKNAKVLLYFLGHQEWTGRTHLVKLLYLADLEARKVLGRPITDLNYVWHHYGPWDKRFFSARDELLNGGFAESHTFQEGGYTHHEMKAIATDGGAKSLSPEELHILHYVTREHMNTALSTLLAKVYDTSPMKAVNAKGELLPMELVDNEVRRMSGINLEEMLECERMAASGEFLLAEDFFDGLQYQTAPPGSATDKGVR